jgi:hypothetical protein
MKGQIPPVPKQVPNMITRQIPKRILLNSFIVVSQAVVCCFHAPCYADSTLTKEETAKYLRQDFWAFDQTDQGWQAILSRPNVGHENDLTAAKLLDQYNQQRKDISPPQHVLLAFHAGQSYALAGVYGEAIARFEHSFMEEQPGWNAYVRATIAFLKKDKKELLEQREKLAAIKGQLNLKVVDDLIENFNGSYADAYEGKAKKGPKE